MTANDKNDGDERIDAPNTSGKHEGFGRTTEFKRLEPNATEMHEQVEVQEFAKIMIKALRASGGRRTITYNELDGCLRFQEEGKDDGKFNLDNLYVEYRSLAPRERGYWLQNTASDILNPMEMPEDFEDVKPDLLPSIRLRSSSEFMRLNVDWQGEIHPMELPSIPVSNHLIAYLVYDLPNKTQFVTPHHLSTWGVTLHEAFEVAMQNLKERECKVKPFERHLFTFDSGDTFDLTRMLMIDRIRSFNLSGDPVAMPVTHDLLLLTGSEDEDGLRVMADFAENNSENARLFCSIPHRLNGDTWGEWMPPADSPVFDRFRVLRLRHLSGLYNTQQSVLNRIFDRKGTDEFVASLTVGKKDSHVLSYCVWSEDVPTWLPEAEFVGFFRYDTGVVGGFVPWDRVRATVGKLMKRTDLYPARWFVDDFPTAEDFEAMGAASARDHSLEFRPHDPNVV